MCMAVVALPLQLITIPVFLIYEEYRSSICYRIMLSIGIADTFQILVHLIMAISLAFDIGVDGPLEEIMGSLLFPAFVVAILQQLVLALNRFLVLLHLNVPKVESKRERLCFNALIFACWVWAAILCVVYLSPVCNMNFDEGTFQLDYDKNSTLCELVEDVEFYTTLPAPVIGLFTYVVIVYRLIKDRKEFNVRSTSVTDMRTFGDSQFGTSINNHQKYNQRLLTARELRILVQCIVGFVFAWIVYVPWQFKDTDSLRTRYFFAGITMLWIIFCAIQPAMYLIMNRKIRRRSLQLFMYFTRNRQTTPETMNYIKK
ncbi:serpentine type 7TM GPCR chemoreceptor srx domain-containing protein [Ditylenchus destructor]|uniref:Serpentine type 7TM GPCR chemoreceptor srx domain-containing protein n=1 Tax=Ditylenchus destructor TaxID=166010 RepID=A0AAD4MMP2_9BILA|nr:serpentine type 7TM GPCR chemoreceptor srx domain-containing protein [Ditylenchus destructor]